MRDYTIDKSKSTLILMGSEEERKKYSEKIDEFFEQTENDAAKRRLLYKRRKDFYEGNQGEYSNIFGVIKDTKQKRGHTNQVTNYAGKTIVKIAYGLANNPPKLTVPGLDESDPIESSRSQAVEDYIESVFNSRNNRFWKKAYRRACFSLAAYGDVGIQTIIVNGEIRIILHEDMGNVRVGWNNLDATTFDCVASDSYMTPKAIEDMYGIKVDGKLLSQAKSRSKTSHATGSWTGNNQWATRPSALIGKSALPSGETDIVSLRVQDYDSEDIYAIKIEGELVQLIIKDDKVYPRCKMWTIVHNIPNPPSPWSIADIDYLMQPQIELNDNDNRTADYLRVGAVQRYVAYNLQDFDPESIKTHSGQVIMINSPDGSGRFDPLPTNVNSFPTEQYHARKMAQIYDMGLPRVNYGSSGADSGRSKAIDYQSSIDITVYKRDSWELAIQDICGKIQIYGYYLLGDKVKWFEDIHGNFVIRDVDFDWTDILPISQADKIVNIANKVNMIGIPMRQAFKELGYRNVDQLISQLKEELNDPMLMIIRSKMWDLSNGILEARNNAQLASMEENPPSHPSVNEQFPTLTSDQNSESAKPMAAKGGTVSFSTPSGFIERIRQNLMAQRG